MEELAVGWRGRASDYRIQGAPSESANEAQCDYPGALTIRGEEGVRTVFLPEIGLPGRFIVVVGVAFYEKCVPPRTEKKKKIKLIFIY